MRLPQAILFDWDETLAHTREAVSEAIEHTLQKYHKEPWEITKNKYRDKTKSFKENFPNFFGKDAVVAYQDYLDYYQKHCFSQVTPNENAADFLTLCHNKGIKLYIISNKEKSLLQHEVKQCFPSTLFEKILGNGDAPQNKPAPAPVFSALQDSTISITPQNVWLIGDSKQDTDCAYQANIQPILLGKGNFMDKTYLREKQTAPLPLLNFSNFHEIMTFLSQLS